jgi:plasmid stabilization system protein ParE
MKIRYVLTETAQQNIDDIVTYIASEYADSRAAFRLETAFYDAFETIGDNPGIGRKRPDWTRKPYRFWTVRGRDTWLSIRSPLPRRFCGSSALSGIFRFSWRNDALIVRGGDIAFAVPIEIRTDGAAVVNIFLRDGDGIGRIRQSLARRAGWDPSRSEQQEGKRNGGDTT